MDVVVTGSLSYDYIMDFPGRFADRIMPEKLHVISLSFLAEKMEKQYGGCATNLAYSLKLLGVDPYLITAAGNDARPYMTFLKKHKIETSGITIYTDEPCSTYFVVTDRDDNQIGAFYIGASRYNDQLSVSEQKNRDFVTIGPTDPKAMCLYVHQCQLSGKRYLYDPSFQIDNFSDDELRNGITGAQILIGNDYEVALIEQKLHISHEELVVMVPILITTLGSKGSVIETRKEKIYCKPAKPKNVSDPTGAGDAYRAGFIAGFVRGFDLATCGQMGSVAAVYTVEKYGTVTHTFTKKQFQKRFEAQYNARIAL